VVTGPGTSWAATPIPLPSDAAAEPDAGITSLTCPSTTSCVLSVMYTTSSGQLQALMVTGSGTSWRTTKVPGVQLGSVACASATSCLAVSVTSSLLVTGSGTSWTATQPPLPANASATPYPSLISAACTSTTSCVAVGFYRDVSNITQPLLVMGPSG
jgi:hypothetical protein